MRRCCGNGACCRAGWQKMPGCSASWGALNGRLGIGPRTARAPPGSHTTGRLEAAERLRERADLAANLEPTDRDYLAACRKAESGGKSVRRHARRVQALVYVLLVGIITGLIGWINQAYVKEQMELVLALRPYMLANVRPYVLTAEAERALKPLASFRECAKDCPEMIVIPAGSS